MHCILMVVSLHDIDKVSDWMLHILLTFMLRETSGISVYFLLPSAWCYLSARVRPQGSHQLFVALHDDPNLGIDALVDEL